MQKAKIALYVKRSMGDKLGASFDFIKENGKLLLKFSTYLLLPLCFVQALSLNGLMSEALALDGGRIGNSFGYANSTIPQEFILYYGFYLVLAAIGGVLLSSLVYAMIRTYQEREERLEGMSFRLLKPLLLRNARKMILMVLLGASLLFSAVFVVAFLAPYALPILFLVLIVLIVPPALWAPVYLLENISIMAALKKSYRLGFATWGGVLLILIIMGIAGGILQGVTMVPWYIAFIAKTFFSSAAGHGSSAVNSIGFNFMLYLLAVVQSFGAYLSAIFTLVGLAYQYGHASEKLDNVTVKSDIDNFDKL